MNPQKKKTRVKREYSAGGAVYKKSKVKSQKLKVLWLIIQPRVSKKEPWRQGRWQLPKGWIDEGETGQQAAVREVKEEGGVEAEIVDKIDTIQIFFYNEEKERVLKSIVFYLMRWVADIKEGPGWETEKVEWLPYEEAYERLAFDSEKKALEKARKILGEKERQPKLL